MLPVCGDMGFEVYQCRSTIVHARCKISQFFSTSLFFWLISAEFVIMKYFQGSHVTIHIPCTSQQQLTTHLSRIFCFSLPNDKSQSYLHLAPTEWRSRSHYTTSFVKLISVLLIEPFATLFCWGIQIWTLHILAYPFLDETTLKPKRESNTTHHDQDSVPFYNCKLCIFDIFLKSLPFPD